MRNVINKISLRHIIREPVFYLLLVWHLLIWVGLVIYAPAYWARSLLLCMLIFIGSQGISNYIQTKWFRKSRTSDRLFTPAFQIANETLPLLRSGFNEENAQKVAEIIQKISDVSAVAITDREKVLAFIGAGCEHHPPGMPIVTKATKEVIATGKPRVVNNKMEFNCAMKDCFCPLEAGVIMPLTCGEQIAGTIKLYQTKKGEISSYVTKLAGGVAQLLSMQMELAELDRQAHLVTEAQLDALQAQINPHFLFNTLNTIGMLIRTNPHTARRLLHRLAYFLRYSFKHNGRFLTLKEDLSFVRNYLILEKARFRDKLAIVKRIDKRLLGYNIPVLMIQPLIENAVRHGITPKEGKGTVKIAISYSGEKDMEITVSDDGVGIKPEIFPRILEPGFGSGSGVGLSNVHERLKMLYGEERGLRIWSEPGIGTTVKFIIPISSGKD